MEAVMRQPLSTAGQSWLESSLQRSSKLGLEVLERAKRRSVDWSSARVPNQKRRAKEKHGENFYKSVGSAKASEREKNHVCRFHSLHLPHTSRRTQPAAFASRRAHCTGLSEPEDFLIEVSPGTYSITAAVQDAGPQTRVVRINAGESKRLTFNL
ncbi:A-kinase-interacting protein 1 isoform X2 [Pygocentrus nattereri]|uniref:A-kinase-interacting protein 1 isoform X2 n=1 Tax=Pygocentrus nattereri TaxID=42514 RepID=UPI001891806E|nr:A-kinase-interacting protein 1 isoform X2 [Pygocentrus nattereri]